MFRSGYFRYLPGPHLPRRTALDRREQSVALSHRNLGSGCLFCAASEERGGAQESPWRVGDTGPRTHTRTCIGQQTLVQEIGERRETERSLRESETSLRASQDELRRSREELRALAGQLLTAQEQDRRRIARDLHDDVNQRLAMLAMDLRRIEKDEMRDLSAIRDRTRSITERLSKVSDDVRQLAYRFHPSILDDLGLMKAVRRLVDDFSVSTGLQAVYVHRDPVIPVPTDLATCVYRIAQESLTNVARPAQASEVEVELICDEGMITLSIRDDGVGFDLGPISQSGAHLGLLSMKERLRLVHGTLEVATSPGEGTHIQVNIPWQGAAYA